MKKIIKSLIVTGLIITFACACGEKNNLVGNWRGEYEYKGNHYVQYYTLNEDGTYVNITIKNSKCNDYKEGHYEEETFKVNLHENGNVGVYEFEKRGNKLINGGHDYVKYNGEIPECE
jgi:hypothetical protein